MQFRMPNAIVYWSNVLSAKSERCSALPRWNETCGAALPGKKGYCQRQLDLVIQPSRPQGIRSSTKRSRAHGLTVVVHGLGEPLLALLEHFGVDVEHGDARLAVSVFRPGVVEDPHRDVARPACDVEALEAA